MRPSITRSSIWHRSVPAIACALAVSIPAGAQSLRVYSEFTRLDPFGEVVRPDRGREPREILSPALPRNAYTGFHLVFSAPPGTNYELHIGQNPENAVAVKLYRERYTQVDGEWIPDQLDPVALPYRGVLGSAEIAGQTSQAFWLDLRVPLHAPIGRIKIEPAVSAAGQWVLYPLEARVVYTTAPDSTGARIAAGQPGDPSDIAARRVLKQKLCRIRENVPAVSTLNIRDLIARDAAQDIAMASVTPDDVVWELTGARDRQAWCRTDSPHEDGPEWFLRIRDRVIGGRR